MTELYKEGKIRALGVSNFYDDRLVDFVISNEVIPAVCQRETHPYNQQWTTQEWMKKWKALKSLIKGRALTDSGMMIRR